MDKNIESFKKYQNGIIEFCKQNELRDHPTKYFEFRKRLVELSQDESLEYSVRLDASMMQRTLSWMFNSVSGAQIKQSNADARKEYPESTLYFNSSHDSLTSKCRAKVVQLASSFEFKPQPLVFGIKHYYGANHGT